MRMPRATQATLFGDGAAACVLRRAGWREGSRLHAARVETYGEGAALTQARGGGTNLPQHSPEDHHAPNPASDYAANHFEMDGAGALRLVLQHGRGFMERLWPGLSRSLGSITWAVPHQASGLALEAILDALGWPAERAIRTIDTLGNCVAASIPLSRSTRASPRARSGAATSACSLARARASPLEASC